MKNSLSKSISKLSLLLASLVVSMIAFAQETKKLDIDINTKSEEPSFFMQPWVWVVGGAVFILLLIALLRGNSNK